MAEPVIARRLGAVPFRWHVARWQHAEPGPRGLILLVLLTLAMLVPLERFGADLTWNAQVRALVTMATVAAALMFGRSAGLPDEAEYWLVLQGHAPADWALARWRANFVALSVLAAVWTLAVLAVALMLGHGIPWAGLGGLLLQLVLASAVISLVTLVLGASGGTQTTELALLILILTFLLPVVEARIPAAMHRLLLWLLPPLIPIVQLRDGVVEGEWRSAASAALHVATWCVAVVALSTRVLRRR